MQLLYPWFALGLFAISIPLIIHLLQLRRPQRLVFTNVAVIKQVELVTTRYRKVQHLLILLTRIVGLIALVLVFCQPFLPVSNSGIKVSGIDVAIDNSFSMQLPGIKFGSLFNEALEGGRQLGNEATTGERFRLLNTGTTTLSKSSFLAKVEELHPNLGMNIGRIAALAGTQNSTNTLYLLSDFQKNAFSASVINQMPSNRKLALVLVRAPETGNVYVDSVWVDDGFVRTKTNVELHMRLRNGGAVTVTDCPVKVYLGARQVAAFQVTIAKGQAITSVVQVQLADGNIALGRVVTEDAPVVYDNTYFFTLQSATPIQILEIGSTPVTQQVYANEPLFNYHFNRLQGVDYALLRQANLVLIEEVATIDAGLRDGLLAVLKRGGSVVVVPAAAAEARAAYQQLFRQLGMGAAQWEQTPTKPELRKVALPNLQEPFFRDVFSAQSRTATMPRVAPVLRWARTGTDILKLRDGESYLAAFPSGAGQVFVFSAPFDKRYSDFTAQALFVPVMYRLAMLSYRSEQLPAYRLTQRNVNLTLPAGPGPAGERAEEAGFRLVKDSITLIPEQRIVGHEVRLAVPQGMDTPGFYQVQKKGRVLTTLAFNPDKRESELAAYTAAELREIIGPNRPNMRVVEASDIGAGLAKLQAEKTGTPLWRYFLLLALLALLAETLLVRFGRRPAVAARVAVAA